MLVDVSLIAIGLVRVQVADNLHLLSGAPLLLQEGKTWRWSLNHSALY